MGTGDETSRGEYDPLPIVPLWLEPQDMIEPVRPPGGASGVDASQSSLTSLPSSSFAVGCTAGSVSSQSVVFVQPSLSASRSSTMTSQARRVVPPCPSPTETSIVCDPTCAAAGEYVSEASVSCASAPSSVHA